MEIGKVKEAKEAYERAIENARKLKETHSQGEENAKLVAMILTATFNLAYWHENNNDVARASDMYKQILREEPTYLDAYLRLSYIYFKKGNH